MARVKLRCIMGCSGLKRSYQEKGLLQLKSQTETPEIINSSI